MDSIRSASTYRQCKGNIEQILHHSMSYHGAQTVKLVAIGFQAAENIIKSTELMLVLYFHAIFSDSSKSRHCV
ncbi:hypothetical protein SAMN04487995_1057 [Dyadobacter koreensis]|uniref:Uncharacterized protein n=1 Tax=Dyadobacter koreensis TaxID=408657 RepID=A0A1H6RFM9_9BACT|nr:hypothetical protein SAMN04487995_1057 [Dyadobacter koreensis]